MEEGEVEKTVFGLVRRKIEPIFEQCENIQEEIDPKNKRGAAEITVSAYHSDSKDFAGCVLIQRVIGKDGFESYSFTRLWPLTDNGRPWREVGRVDKFPLESPGKVLVLLYPNRSSVVPAINTLAQEKIELSIKSCLDDLADEALTLSVVYRRQDGVLKLVNI